MGVLLATHWWDLQPGHVRTMVAGVAQNPPASKIFKVRYTCKLYLCWMLKVESSHNAYMASKRNTIKCV